MIISSSKHVFVLIIVISFVTSCSVLKKPVLKNSPPTKLHIASSKGALHEVKQYLIAGSNVNKEDEKGNTPLHEAVFGSNIAVVKELLANGAYINARNKNGRTPLHAAIEHAAIENGNYKLVEMLLKKKADPNIKDKYGNTPLHNAALYGHQKFSKLLIDSGVNIEAKNYNGRTPLYVAVEKGNTKLVSLFLRENADPNAKDKYGNTPLQEAVLLGDKDISSTLFKHGAIFPNESYDNVLKNSSAKWLSSAFSLSLTDTKKYKYTEYYPAFSWPPPLASTRIVIPRQFLEQSKKEKKYIYDIDKLLSNALSLAGYSEKSYYSVPNGFALATRLEQINADGTPKKRSLRWKVELPSLESFSLRSYITALFTAPTGFYRVIVFVVVPHPFTEVRVPIVRSQALKWLSQGSNELPNSIKEREYSEDYSCTALIYEFEKPKFIKDANITMPSRLQAQIHLVKSGLWKRLIDE